MIALDRPNHLVYAADAVNNGIGAFPFTDCGSGTVNAVKVYNQGLGPSSLLIGAAVTPGVQP